jgi:hypothetical protein
MASQGQGIREKSSLRFLASPFTPWIWKQYVYPKCWHMSTSLYGATSHSNNMILKVVQTSPLTTPYRVSRLQRYLMTPGQWLRSPVFFVHCTFCLNYILSWPFDFGTCFTSSELEVLSVIYTSNWQLRYTRNIKIISNCFNLTNNTYRKGV